MGDTTKIEWCDHTFNAWYGCTKVGPPCDNCYAEGWAKRSGLVGWGPHAERRRASPDYWKQPQRWNAAAQAAGERRRVFSLSLGDWLDNKVPQQWRVDLALLIAQTPWLDWLLLTKRIQNYRKLAPWSDGGDNLAPPDNVWLGITCGDGTEYRRDWPRLSEIPATVRFISYEPALGPLTIGLEPNGSLPDWIICGGESGPRARYMDPSWAADLMDDCARFGVSFFLKQMTGKAPIPASLMVRQFPTPRLAEAA